MQILCSSSQRVCFYLMKIVFLAKELLLSPKMAFVLLLVGVPGLTNSKTMRRNSLTVCCSIDFPLWIYFIFGNKFNEPSSFGFAGNSKLNENIASVHSKSDHQFSHRQQQHQPLIKHNFNSFRFLSFND